MVIGVTQGAQPFENVSRKTEPPCMPRGRAFSGTAQSRNCASAIGTNDHLIAFVYSEERFSWYNMGWEGTSLDSP